MMRIRSVAVLMLLVITATPAVAQPIIPEDSIPKDMDPELAAKLRRLYSKDPIARAEAAGELAVYYTDREAELSSWSEPRELDCQRRMTPAIPWLIAMCYDSAPLKWASSDPRGGTEHSTSPREEARSALVSYGRSAVGPLIEAFTDPRFADTAFQQQLNYTLGYITGQRDIRGQEAWKAWWAAHSAERLPQEIVEWSSGTWMFLLFVVIGLILGAIVGVNAIQDRLKRNTVPKSDDKTNA